MDEFLHNRREIQQQHGMQLGVMLAPCLRRISVSSPSAFGEVEAKGVHTSKRANIISTSEVAELHDSRFLIVFVVVVTGDNALPESH